MLAFGLEEKVGLVPCAVEVLGDGRGQATFTLPRLPEEVGAPAPDGAIAAALGLDASEIGFAGHRPTLYSAGNPFCFVPVSGAAAVARARIVRERWNEAILPVGRGAAFIYSNEVTDAGSRYHARMFSPHFGIDEDPATGSAVAAFAGVVMRFDPPGDGDHLLVVEQGYEMGRPSQITLGLTVEEGRLVRATIGGSAVVVSEGALRL
jgi:trans-2,3-dihydro-3-hydroxyanthranilate isomerase